VTVPVQRLREADEHWRRDLDRNGERLRMASEELVQQPQSSRVSLVDVRLVEQRRGALGRNACKTVGEERRGRLHHVG
jgi:hypothetical protein